MVSLGGVADSAALVAHLGDDPNLNRNPHLTLAYPHLTLTLPSPNPNPTLT
jgi:hypothetical protein